MIGSRSKLRDGPHRIYDVTIHMTPRQAEQFYDALWIVASHHREPWTKGGQAALSELRRRIIVAADLEP